jgi:hypothetical protein
LRIQPYEEESMTASTLAAFAKAAPFRPFYLKMADGSVHTVLHPEMIAVGKRLAIAFAPDGEAFAMLDLTLMTEAGPIASNTEGGAR